MDKRLKKGRFFEHIFLPFFSSSTYFIMKKYKEV